MSGLGVRLPPPEPRMIGSKVMYPSIHVSHHLPRISGETTRVHDIGTWIPAALIFPYSMPSPDMESSRYLEFLFLE